MKGEPTPYEQMGYTRDVDPGPETLYVSTYKSGGYTPPDGKYYRDTFKVKSMAFEDGQWHIICVDGLEHWFNADQLREVHATEWWRNKSTLRTSKGETYGNTIMKELDRETMMWLHDHQDGSNLSRHPNYHKMKRLLETLWWLEWHCCGP